MRITIDLDDSLLKRLRNDAQLEGIPIRALLHRVILRGLEAEAHPRPTPYVPTTFNMGPVREGVNLVKALQLSGELEDEEIIRKMNADINRTNR